MTAMTAVAFYFNIPDKQAFACRLLRKAVNGGARVVVTAQAQELQQLDQLLWTFSPLDFIPHAPASAEPRVLAASKVVLSESAENSLHSQVLLNLGTTTPAGFEKFERLIEIVSQDDADRQLARTRWKHYADLGYAIERHDIAQKEVN